MSDQSHYKSNEADFTRSPDNPGALLNTNNAGLQQYKKTKTRMKQLNNIGELERRIEHLEHLIHQLTVEKN